MKKNWIYKKIGEVAFYPKDRISSILINEDNYVGVDNLVKDRKGKVKATFVPAEGSCIEYLQGDVLLGNIRPYLKKIWLANNNGGASGDVLILRAINNQELLSDFLYWSMANDAFFEYDMLHSKGAKMPRGNKKDILDYLIPIPSLSEQKHISDELYLLTDIIEKKKVLIREHNKLALALFHELFGDPVTNCHWELKKISDVCILKSGNSDSNNSPLGDLPYVKVGDMNIAGNETFITVSSNYVDRKTNSSNIFPIGTTIFPKRGGAILTNKKRLTKVEICCDLNIMGVIPNVSLIHPIYVFFYFLGIDFKRFSNTGSTIPQINNYDIAPMDISVPPIELQNQFAKMIEAIENQKALIIKSIKEVETLFNSRMNYYFN